MKTRKRQVFKSTEGKNRVLAVYDSVLGSWPVPLKEMHIDTRLGCTYVIASGDEASPPLVLLHGTSSNSAFWCGEVVEYARFRRVYAVDIPGEPGRSGDIQHPIKGTDYTGWLLDVWHGLGLDRAALLGVSLGGWAAIGFASRHPERVDRLVLLCPSGVGPQRLSFMFRAIPLMLLGEKGADRIARMVAGGQSIPREALEYSKLISRSFNLRAESVPIYPDAELSQLTMPTLLYAGKKDVLLDSAKTGERLKRLLPRVEAHLLTGQGHILTGLSGEIASFLKNK
ncbi:MAG: alpha/beta hydrolase [Firmicutes bacterium]|nr:alpha/beta hydrolase [Bacillota bacterium]